MKTFPPKQRDRLTGIVIERAREGPTIGAMERLAGVPRDNASRLEFWRQFLPIEKNSGTQAMFTAAMDECRRRISEKIEWVLLEKERV